MELYTLRYWKSLVTPHALISYERLERKREREEKWAENGDERQLVERRALSNHEREREREIQSKYKNIDGSLHLT